MRHHFIGDESPAPVAAPEPYPEIAPHPPNRRMAQLFLQDIAYTKGEMTATCQYLYQHWMLEKTHPALADTLLRIARVEMHHLELLGGMVRALGGDPRFCCVQQSSCQCWSGNMVSYDGSVRKMLQRDLAAERDAADIYLSQARFIRDDNVSAVLTRLAADEKLHAQLIERFLDALPREAGKDANGARAAGRRRKL